MKGELETGDLRIIFDRRPTNVVVLDMDSGVSPIYGEQECTSSRANRHLQIDRDQPLYQQRYRIENMFGRLIKNWRHIHTRYDRCAHTFMSSPPSPSPSPRPPSSGYNPMSPEPGSGHIKHNVAMLGCAIVSTWAFS